MAFKERAQNGPSGDSFIRECSDTLKNEHLCSYFLGMAKPVQFLPKDQQTWVKAVQMRSSSGFEEHHLAEGGSVGAWEGDRFAEHNAAGIVHDGHRIQMGGRGVAG